MPTVKVWNDNTIAFTEKFKGEQIHIAAGKFLEMDYEEAIEFRGQYHKMEFDGDGTQLRSSYKMIRVENPEFGLHEKVSATKCQSCAQLFGSDDELDVHIRQYHIPEMADPKAKEAAEKTVRSTLDTNLTEAKAASKKLF